MKRTSVVLLLCMVLGLPEGALAWGRWGFGNGPVRQFFRNRIEARAQGGVGLFPRWNLYRQGAGNSYYEPQYSQPVYVSHQPVYSYPPEEYVSYPYPQYDSPFGFDDGMQPGYQGYQGYEQPVAYSGYDQGMPYGQPQGYPGEPMEMGMPSATSYPLPEQVMEQPDPGLLTSTSVSLDQFN
jgi:hypothetical protein